MNTQEWLSANRNRQFPFAERTASESPETPQVPKDFLLDLQLIISPYESEEVHLISVTFDSIGDTFDLTFLAKNGGDQEEITFSGIDRRLSLGESDAGKKRSATQDHRVLMFTPGESWDSPVANGLEDGETEFAEGVARVHPQRVHSGPDTFKGFYLTAPYYSAGSVLEEEDETVPGDAEMPGVESQTLMAGYNLTFSGSSADTISISMIPGAGEGVYPCPDRECHPPILSINSVRPNSRGSFFLSPYDCLRLGGTGEVDEFDVPLNNGVRIFSDCLPCCQCKDYTMVARAISRQSAKLKDVNNELNQMIECAQLSYDEAVSLINAQSPGLVSIHSIQGYPSRIYFTVQNLSSTPLYAVVSVNIPEGSDVTYGPDDRIMNGVQNTMPPLTGLAATSSDTDLTDPEDSEGWVDYDLTFTVGYGDDFSPIPPGQSVRLYIYSPAFEATMNSLSGVCAMMEDFYKPPGEELASAYLLDGVLQGFIEDYQDEYFPSSLWHFDGVAYWNGCGWIPDACASGAVDSGTWVYAGLENLDGAPRCVDKDDIPGPPSEDYSLLTDTCAKIYEEYERGRLKEYAKILARKAELLFSQTICGDTITPSEDLAVFTSLKNLNSQGDESALTYLYGRAEDIAERLLTEYGEAIAACLDAGILWDAIPMLEIVAAPIYGDLNFGCKAFVGNFSTHDDEVEGDAYQCLDRTLSLFAYSIEL